MVTNIKDYNIEAKNCRVKNKQIRSKQHQMIIISCKTPGSKNVPSTLESKHVK